MPTMSCDAARDPSKSGCYRWITSLALRAASGNHLNRAKITPKNLFFCINCFFGFFCGMNWVFCILFDMNCVFVFLCFCSGAREKQKATWPRQPSDLRPANVGHHFLFSNKNQKTQRFQSSSWFFSVQRLWLSPGRSTRSAACCIDR